MTKPNRRQDLITKYSLQGIKTPFTCEEFQDFTGLSPRAARYVLHAIHERGFVKKFHNTYHWTPSGRSQHTLARLAGLM